MAKENSFLSRFFNTKKDENIAEFDIKKEENKVEEKMEAESVDTPKSMNHNGEIPLGGIYIQDGKEYRFGDQFPEPKTGDIYKFGGYQYVYNKKVISDKEPIRVNLGFRVNQGEYKEKKINGEVKQIPVRSNFEPFGKDNFRMINSVDSRDLVSGIDYVNSCGWCALATNVNAPLYPPALCSIAGQPVTNMDYAYRCMHNLKIMPPIPPTVESAVGIGMHCCSLKIVPDLSNTKIMYLDNAFEGCYSLTNVSGMKLPETTLTTTSMFASTGVQFPPDMSDAKNLLSAQSMFLNSKMPAENIPSLSDFEHLVENGDKMMDKTASITSFSRSSRIATSKAIQEINDHILKENVEGRLNGPFMSKDGRSGTKYDPAPTEIKDGDKYINNGYEFIYKEKYGGWDVKIYLGGYDTMPEDIDFAPSIPETVLGKEVKAMNMTYYGCKNIDKFPDPPKTVEYMCGTYESSGICGSGVKLPPNLKQCDSVFMHTRLWEAPEIPKSVESVNSLFSNCHLLHKAPDLSTLPNLKEAKTCFHYCTALEEISPFKEGVDITDAYKLCDKIKDSEWGKLSGEQRVMASGSEIANDVLGDETPTVTSDNNEKSHEIDDHNLDEDAR